MTLFIFILAAIAIYYLFIYKGSEKSRVAMNKNKVCTNCKNPVEESFNVCPACKETLKKKCRDCGERIDAQWRYCPYCEKQVNESEAQ